MIIETLLDHPAILANQGTPVHLALRFTAPTLESKRSQPIAFCVVLDRSGSMQGEPLDQAKEAARRVVQNLRKDDQFALILFDNRAQTLIPLQANFDREAALKAIDRIHTGGSTNLTGGWMLGRDALKGAPKELPKKILLLSDGHLNVGITEPEQVKQIVAQGLEQHGIRTSCLGFGPDYLEDLMAALAAATGGSFHDARQPDSLPHIFDAELEGLQSLTVQNLRVRMKRSTFCETAVLLSDYPVVDLLENHGSEISVGDLVSEEQRTLVLFLEVLPLPLIQGKPAASLEGEALLECEFLWDAIQKDSVSSHTEKRTIRVLAVQDESEVRHNEEIIPFIAAQQAGRSVSEAVDRVDQGQVEEAIEGLKKALQRIKAYGVGTDLTDALNTLHEALWNLEPGLGWRGHSRKNAIYRSRASSRMSTRDIPSDLYKIVMDPGLELNEKVHLLQENHAPTWVIKEAMNQAERGRRGPEKTSEDGEETQ